MKRQRWSEGKWVTFGKTRTKARGKYLLQRHSDGEERQLPTGWFRRRSGATPRASVRRSVSARARAALSGVCTQLAGNSEPPGVFELRGRLCGLRLRRIPAQQQCPGLIQVAAQRLLPGGVVVVRIGQGAVGVVQLTQAQRRVRPDLDGGATNPVSCSKW